MALEEEDRTVVEEVVVGGRALFCVLFVLEMGEKAADTNVGMDDSVLPVSGDGGNDDDDDVEDDVEGWGVGEGAPPAGPPHTKFLNQLLIHDHTHNTSTRRRISILRKIWCVSI